VPDVNNQGLVVIDFESWRPIFRQNWGSLLPYKEISYNIEKERHRFWPTSMQEAEASEHITLNEKKKINVYSIAGRATIRECWQGICRRDFKAIEKSSSLR
jgi:Hyaluronidase